MSGFEKILVIKLQYFLDGKTTDGPAKMLESHMRKVLYMRSPR